MRYEYTHFIPQNVAPKGATKIIVKDGDGKEVGSIPASLFGSLAHPTGEPNYSFGLVSDPHITLNSTLKSARLERAFRYFAEQGCAFICDCGDSTNLGFTVSGDTVDTSQFEEYRRIRQAVPSLPVYSIAGNHDHYNAQLTGDYSPTLPTDTTLSDGTVYPAGTPLLTLYEHYTGHGITYEVTRGDDVFLFVGQPTNGVPMSYTDRDWLVAKLAEHAGRRCFVFVHSFLDDGAEGGIEDSGNPCYARDNSIFNSWNASTTQSLMNAFAAHGRVILFHGHSHMMFEAQVFDENACYTKRNGFHSVGVPSIGDPRLLTAADGTWETGDRPQCYLVDVYADCIVLNGLELGTDGVARAVPLGTYRIPMQTL